MSIQLDNVGIAVRDIEATISSSPTLSKMADRTGLEEWRSAACCATASQRWWRLDG